MRHFVSKLRLIIAFSRFTPQCLQTTKSAYNLVWQANEKLHNTNRMGIAETIVLAAIQGLLEFVPISSSGHVVIIAQLAGWDDPGFIFDSVVHFSSLFAIIFYFRRSFLNMRPSNDWTLQFDKNDKSVILRVALLLLVAIIPISAVGVVLVLTLESFIAFFRTTEGFGASLIKKNTIKLERITFRNAFIIGLAQAISVIPGISRSGMTISTGIYLHFTYLTATRFALLLAIPTLVGTGVVVAARGFGANEEVNVLLLLLAFAISAVTALVSVHIVTVALRRASLIPFATYTLIAGTLILFLNSITPAIFD